MTLDGLRVLYLHGFASSPASRKAQLFFERLGSLGIQLEIPDLTEGDFTRLTVTRQLHLLERLLAGEPAVLIGSSLGGYLAALYASRHAEVARLILLAPAFDFYRLWTQELGPERIDQWKANGTMLVFHHAHGREMPLGFEFLEDARAYDPFPSFAQPALLFHGDRDSIVPVEHSVTFQKTHSGTRLVRLDSGHELTDVLEPIWLEARSFLLSGE
jgi:pimeloyl-ACP methyl ester carboxylesterase